MYCFEFFIVVAMAQVNLLTILKDQNTDGKNISNFMKNTDKKGLSNQTESLLRPRLSLLESYWKDIFQRHRILCQHEEELKKEKYFELQAYEEFEEAYTSAKATLLDRLEALATPAADHNTPLQLITSHTSLPKVSLLTFSGIQTEWETLKERFNAMVRTNTSLSLVVKLQHLLSCLEGEPTRRIKNFEITGSNFTVAWEALTRRYDNKQVRLSAHLQKFLSMPAAYSRSSKHISDLLDAVALAKRAFSLLGRPVDQWDDWFIDIVTSRLDERT